VRCLVTGATGIIGSHLVGALLDRGCDVSAILRPGGHQWRLGGMVDRIRVVEGDLARLTDLTPTILEIAPEVVFHLGWEGTAGSRRSDPQLVAGNLHASLQLLQVAAQAGCQCWVGLGSQAEYGCRDEVLREDLPVRPDSPYGVAKLCAGLAGQELAAALGIRFLWLRVFAVYGPMDAAEHLIPYVITDLLNGQAPSLTPGEQRWDYLYVSDAVDAICQAALETEATGIFNLASGCTVTVRRVAEEIRDLIDPSGRLGFGERPYPVGQPMRLEADISRLARATGWKPRTSLLEGLRRTVEWHRGIQTPAPFAGPPQESRCQ